MPIVVDAWSSAQPSTRSKLIEKVVRLYGMDASSTKFNQLALDSLDETVNDMNTACYEFNRVTESGIVLDSNQNWVMLSTNFYKESQAYLADNSGGDAFPMDYLPYVHFKRLYPNETIQGAPTIYTIFNFEQDGRVYLYPSPNEDTVNRYTLAVEYYRRIPLISSVGASASIEVPREVESALVYGAQKRMAVTVQGAGHPDVAALAGLESQALERLKRVDKLHPDEKIRFKVVDFNKRAYWNGQFGYYIKIN